MIEDPIVEEVRKRRQARAAKFNYDIDAMVADARKREKASGHPIVNFEKMDKRRKAHARKPRQAKRLKRTAGAGR